jgi:DNA-binding GntR family transcriptional regulator
MTETARAATRIDTASPAVSEQVATYLRDAILSGEIRPGERILQEAIAEQFGASRLPVREALRMLEVEGLTELEPNKGARVPKLDMHQVSVLYQLRERIEPLALIESLPRIDQRDVGRLTEIHDQIQTDDDVATFLRLDREFHLLSYARCGSDQMLTTVTRFWNATHFYRREFMRFSGPGRRWVVNAEHALILDSIERRDPVDAERYLSGHIRRTRIELERHPEVFA